jgi:hypothetical protein
MRIGFEEKEVRKAIGHPAGPDYEQRHDSVFSAGPAPLAFQQPPMSITPSYKSGATSFMSTSLVFMLERSEAL